MRLEEALTNCRETVRQHDTDRYLAALFAPAPLRPLIFALYAFNYEIARLGEHSREPMLAAMRLQWWRETIEEAREGRPRAHPVAIGIAEVFARFSPSAELFAAMLDAREFDVGPETFADFAALETYCEATSSGSMKIAAHVLGVGAEKYLRHAGIAYALAGLLRSIAFHAARRKLFLPLDLLAAEGLDAETIFTGSAPISGRHGTVTRKDARAPGECLHRIVRRIGLRAKEHLARANAVRAPRGAFIAALPAALVRLHLKPLTKQGSDPFGRQPDAPVYRRQIALLRAAASSRL